MEFEVDDIVKLKDYLFENGAVSKNYMGGKGVKFKVTKLYFINPTEGVVMDMAKLKAIDYDSTYDINTKFLEKVGQGGGKRRKKYSKKKKKSKSKRSSKSKRKRSKTRRRR